MKISFLSYFSIISSIVLIIFHLAKWVFLELFTHLLMPLVWLSVYGFFILVFIFALSRFFKGKEKLPFLIQSIVLLLVIIVPFDQLLIDFNYKYNKLQRNEVVSMVRNGTIKPADSLLEGTVQLPNEYSHLSKSDGYIEIEKQDNVYAILFYTYNGIQDDFNGYIYTSNNKKPSIYSFGGDLKEIQRVDNNWFYVNSY